MHPWRIVCLSSFFLLGSGCGLFLDTSPRDDAKPDGGVCSTAACTDDIACTVDECVDGACAHRPDDSLCRPNETCVAGFGCASALTCTTDAECTSLARGVCGTASCNTDIGRCVAVLDDARCNDEVVCTADVCLEDGSCKSTASDALCDDAATCTSETCAPESDDAGDDGCIRERNFEICDDGVACTNDTCDPTALVRDPVTGCVNYPQDYLCVNDTVNTCATPVCVPQQGCGWSLSPEDCGGGYMACDLVMNLCLETPCEDDGNPCNGEETRDDATGGCVRVDVCGVPTDPCKESYCDTSTPGVYACAERVRPTPDCYGAFDLL